MSEGRHSVGRRCEGNEPRTKALVYFELIAQDWEYRVVARTRILGNLPLESKVVWPVLSNLDHLARAW